MLAAIPFPDLSPTLLEIELGSFTFALRWYALAYIAGILGGFALARAMLRRPALWPAATPPLDRDTLEDAMTWVVLGIVLGGRLGFVLFYQPGYYLQNPGEILAVWQGGMSFHGGALGVLLGLWVFAWRRARPVLSVWDLAAMVAPIGIALGRVANFVNAELWGRPTDLPWGVIFPGPAAQACADVAGLCARHPSQLYEALLEGVVLLAVLVAVALRGGLRRPGLVFGLFVAGYGMARTFVETFRVADAQYVTPDNPLGHVIGGPVWGLTMGQALSVPMVVVGLAVVAWALRRRPAAA